MRSLRASAAVIVLLAGLSGCQDARRKQLEQENAGLRAELAQTAEQLEQVSVRNRMLANAVAGRLSRIEEAGQREIRMKGELVELRKRLQQCQVRIARVEKRAAAEKKPLPEHRDTRPSVNKER